MNDFIAFMQKILGLFQVKFTVYGHSISFWDVFIWCLVVSTVFGFIAHILSD